MKIAVVGVCASGKSTLVNNLKKEGYCSYSVAQEHSYVPDLWNKKLPDVLIYLDCNYESIKQRRKINWNIDRFKEQKKRLLDAYRNSNIYIDTSSLTKEEVLNITLSRFKKESP